MARRIQYPRLFAPLVAPETVSVDKWGQPPSQPVRRRRLLASTTLGSGVIAPPLVHSWNPNDTAGPIALSNGNLTATPTSSAAQGVRSTTSKSGGKVYIEFTMATMVANTSAATVGIANATEILNSGAQLGASVNSMGFYPSNPNQSTYVNSVNLNSTTASVAGTVIVGMAIDFTTTPPTLYVTDQVMRAAGLPWNNLSNADPVTGTQGTVLTGLTGAPYFAAYNDFGDTPAITCTANFGASAFNYSIPIGYTSWDGSQTGAAAATADSWVQPASQPVRRVRMGQPSGAIGVFLQSTPEIVTADKWLQPPSQPTRRASPQQAGGAVGPFVQNTSPEVITLDKWFQPAAQPVIRRPTQQPNGASAPLSQSPEAVSLDRWAQPTNQPTRRRPTQQPSGSFAAIVTTGEVVMLDKWFQPASQPVRRVPLYAALAPGFVTQYVQIPNPPPQPKTRALVSWLD
jgi:hypothetical protein